MSDIASLESIDALPQFAGRLQALSARAQQGLDTSASNVLRRLRALEDHLSDLRADVRRYEEMLANADEETRAEIQWRLEQREESLHRFQRKFSEVESAFERYRRAVMRFRPAMGQAIQRAVGLLREKEQNARVYQAVQLENIQGAGIALEAAAPLSPVLKLSVPQPDPANCPLPPRFAWININQIPEQLRPGEPFNHGVSADQMQDGFRKLAEVILPALRDPEVRGTGEAFFLEQDRLSGAVRPDGLAPVYEAFFGSDSIEVRTLPDGNFDLTRGGRHRISVANQLGWTAVPAMVLG